jgi:hypothetical protein
MNSIWKLLPTPPFCMLVVFTPSIRYTFSESVAPSIWKPLSRLEVPLCRGSCRAPGAKGITDWNERPFGILSRTCRSTVTATLLWVVSMARASPLTSTVSVTTPTWSCTSTFGKRPTVKSMPLCL